MNVRRFTLPALSGTAALAIVALSAGAASAHVTVTPNVTSAGSYAVLTFSVGHGCEGSPTTKMTIAMPEEIPSVTPTVNPNWSVEKVAQKLDKPIKDAHGNEITERIAQVVYTAKTPLVDGYRDTVELSVQLPDAVGETLAFPVVQTCAKGETGWTETAAEGQDAEELEHPAPTVTITEASAEGHHGGAASDKKDADHEETSNGKVSANDRGTNDNGGVAVVGLVAGLGGLALGGLALARTRKA
ncbi:YcnI family protein [Nocardioides sp. WS12]|uniref:YcnI family copper-binding membrane protein n=1 Tax=Nocardioides sp. WS12 TaxID=2486272 RepID=UPI0015FAAB79|nr:YcnI family protein [Nocardioides sp. WS12]